VCEAPWKARGWSIAGWIVGRSRYGGLAPSRAVIFEGLVWYGREFGPGKEEADSMKGPCTNELLSFTWWVVHSSVELGGYRITTSVLNREFRAFRVVGKSLLMVAPGTSSIAKIMPLIRFLLRLFPVAFHIWRFCQSFCGSAWELCLWPHFFFKDGG